VYQNVLCMYIQINTENNIISAYQMRATALLFQLKWTSQDSYGPWTQGNKFLGMASNPFYLVTWAWVTQDQYLSMESSNNWCKLETNSVFQRNNWYENNIGALLTRFLRVLGHRYRSRHRSKPSLSAFSYAGTLRRDSNLVKWMTQMSKYLDNVRQWTMKRKHDRY